MRRYIAASPGRLFEAWTTPAQLLPWWGPAGGRCTAAEVDLRVGGHYRLGNALPDGAHVHITGEFLMIDPGRRLVYTWALEGSAEAAERVTVEFQPRGSGTDVIVIHEHIHSEVARRSHERGWQGCLDRLAPLLR